MNFIDKKTAPHKYRVNVLHQGKERWKYCKSIKRARILQQGAIAAGLSSIICQKIEGKYQVI